MSSTSRQRLTLTLLFGNLWRLKSMVKCLLILPIVAVGVFCLIFFFGFRVDFDGSGIFPVLSFHKMKAHYDAVEFSRAQQKQAFSASDFNEETQRSDDFELVQVATAFRS